MIQQVCVYCLFPLNPTGAGLDRKDPHGSYSADNVVPCCQECNIARNVYFTHEEFLAIGATIRTVKLNRL